jgi:transcriptional regulator of heat shock response
MLSERQEQILNLLIQEYIDSAEPVSSRCLEKKDKFGICPATIRIEMQKLTSDGYLCQPHTSAGRVPTDKGYRFFVDQLSDENSVVEGTEDFLEIWQELEKEMEDSFRFARTLAKKISQETSNLATAYFPEDEITVKEGWSEIFKDPEFDEAGYVERFAKTADGLEEKLEEFDASKEMEVFIGRENSMPEAKDFSLIVSKFSLPDEKQGFMAILGPKRMAYDKNINLINSLKKFLENF